MIKYQKMNQLEIFTIVMKSHQSSFTQRRRKVYIDKITNSEMQERKNDTKQSVASDAIHLKH